MPQRLKWLLAAMLVVPACHGQHKAEAPDKAEPAAAPTAQASVHSDSLDREGVILAALHAMTDAATGRDDSAAQRALRGRKFSARIRFGCPGMADPERTWSYDENKHVLRVKVRSSLTDDALPKSDLLAKQYQGVVGFALGRPWLLSAGCPVAGFGAVATSEPVILIAQLFTDADSRVQRPQRDYALTRQAEPDQQPSDGLDLVISGRLAELADGRPIHCAAQGGAPACIVSARIDRVAIENPASHELLGEWGSGAEVSTAD